MFADEPIIRFDAEKGRGVAQTIAAARSALGNTPRAVTATYLAWALPDAVVHWWDDEGDQQFVANDSLDGLVNAPRDWFEARSLPISNHLGADHLVGDGEAEVAEDQDSEPQTFRFAVRVTTHLPMDGFAYVEASSAEEAVEIVKRDFERYEEQLNNEGMERVDHYLNCWEGFSPYDIEDAERLA